MKSLNIPHYIIIPALIIIGNALNLFIFYGLFNQINLSFIGGLAIVIFIVWETVIVLSFWNKFPRQDRHFNITLALFIIYGLLLLLLPFALRTQIVAPAILVIFTIAQAIVGLSIIISLLTHKLYPTAASAMLFLALITTDCVELLKPSPTTNNIHINRLR